MALRTWLHRLATGLSDLSVLRRRCVVILWRLRQTSDVSEATCSFTEPTPDIFHVLLTYNGRPEIGRVLHGIDLLVAWSENVKARLHADGWREVDAWGGSQRVPGRIGGERRTMKMGEAHVQGGSPSPTTKRG